MLLETLVNQKLSKIINNNNGQLLIKACTRVDEMFANSYIMHKDVIDSAYGRLAIPIEVMHVYLTWQYELNVHKGGFSLYIHSIGIENTLTVWGFLLDLGLEEQAYHLKQVYDRVMNADSKEIDHFSEAEFDNLKNNASLIQKDLDRLGQTIEASTQIGTYYEIEPTVVEALLDYIELNEEIFTSFIS